MSTFTDQAKNHFAALTQQLQNPGELDELAVSGVQSSGSLVDGDVTIEQLRALFTEMGVDDVAQLLAAVIAFAPPPLAEEQTLFTVPEVNSLLLLAYNGKISGVVV